MVLVVTFCRTCYTKRPALAEVSAVRVLLVS